MSATRFVDLPAGHPVRRLLPGRTPWFAAPADPGCADVADVLLRLP